MPNGRHALSIEMGTVRENGYVATHESSTAATALGAVREDGYVATSDSTEPDGNGHAKALDTGHSGTWVFATLHIVTAVIGAGVLSLPNAMAELGIPSGLLLLLAFYISTMWTSRMLAEAKDVATPGCGTYRQLVAEILGERTSLALLICQYVQLVLVCIGYTVTAGDSLMGTLEESCISDPASIFCNTEAWTCTFLFGSVQLGMSQMPSLESAWWSSLVGAAMSVLYSCIAVGMGLAKASNKAGTVYGRPAPPVEKMFNIFESLGTLAFAYSFSSVLVEIQATLKRAPASSVRASGSSQDMKKAIWAGVTLSALFYAAVSLAGNMALGDHVPGDILAGFPDGGPIMGIANMAVLLHMVMAYQVFAQPVFELLQSVVAERLAAIGVDRRHFSEDALTMRIVLRSTFVILATLAASAVPLFSEIISFIGALTFWLPSIHLPIAMHIKLHKTTKAQRVAMQTLNIAVLCVCLCAVIASFRILVMHAIAPPVKAGFGGEGADADTGRRRYT